MRLRGPRITMRRLMVAVAIMAVATAGFIEAGKWARLARARRQFERVEKYREEGRVTLDRCVAASRRLMDASMALCLTRRDKAATITAHVERVTREAGREREWDERMPTRGNAFAELAEAELEVAECQEMLVRLTGER